MISYLHEHYDRDIDERLIACAPDRKGHDRRYAVDPGKIRAELDWRPQVPFEQGLAGTIDWYVGRGR